LRKCATWWDVIGWLDTHTGGSMATYNDGATVRVGDVVPARLLEPV